MPDAAAVTENPLESGARSPTVLDELRWRGLLALTTDEDALEQALAAGPITAYCGFDPTAPSLHFGNLVQLIVLRQAATRRAPGDLPGRRVHRADRRPAADRRAGAQDQGADRGLGGPDPGPGPAVPGLRRRQPGDAWSTTWTGRRR